MYERRWTAAAVVPLVHGRVRTPGSRSQLDPVDDAADFTLPASDSFFEARPLA
jgi:hypothetical protein